MSILNKYNKTTNPYEFEPKNNVEYKNLAELFEAGIKEVPILSMFINTKGKFGDSPVVCTYDYNINLPNHMLDTVKEMNTDVDVIDLANSGKLGIQIYEYNSKKWGKNYSVNFIEVLPF